MRFNQKTFLSLPGLTKKLIIMKKNMGIIDIIIRLLVAALVVVLYFTSVITGTLAIILLIVAGIFTLTSIFGICPLYSLIGVSTKKKIE